MMMPGGNADDNDNDDYHDHGGNADDNGDNDNYYDRLGKNTGNSLFSSSLTREREGTSGKVTDI